MNILKKGGLLLLILFALSGTLTSSVSYSFGSTVLRYGSNGGDVYELQGRLKYLGYYKGSVDGIYGRGTYWAVRNFQYKFGMKVDGVVGYRTKNMLVRATRNWSPANSYATGRFSSNDVTLMARAVHGEARGEPYTGQVAVAAVILNRVDSASFPNTVSGVIHQPGAFTAVDDGQIWLTPNDTAYRAVRDAINGWDPSYGAIYYFNPDTATSKWIWSRPQIIQIGKHIFCK